MKRFIRSVSLLLLFTFLATAGLSTFSFPVRAADTYIPVSQAQSAQAFSADNPFLPEDQSRQRSLSIADDSYISQTFTTHTNTAETARDYIVQFNRDLSYNSIKLLLTGFDYELIGNSSLKLFAVKAASLSLLKEQLQGTYEYIEENKTIRQQRTANDPYLSQQWALPAMNIPAAWEHSIGSDQVTVAVIDSGICRSHADLAGANILSGWDYFADAPVSKDYVGHGTMTTGIIAAQTNNGLGIAGICWNVEILPLCVVDKDGFADLSDLCTALYDAANLGADVINLSLGSTEPSYAENAAINYALSKGCIVIAAAGNDGTSDKNYPASYEGVISVASVDSSLTTSYFSNYNDSVDVSAPGEYVITTSDKSIDDADYLAVDGTSFSCAYVSGIAALARAVNDNISSFELEYILQQTSTDKGPVGFDYDYGYGLINADRVLEFTSSYTDAAYTYIANPENCTAVITGYTGSYTVLNMPETIDEYVITKIGDNAFKNNTSITRVFVSETVLEIGSGAFEGCGSLHSVILPNGLQTIGSNAFSGCGKLNELVLPSGLKSIQEKAFYKSGIINVRLPASLETLGNEAFMGSTGLTECSVEEENPYFSSENGVLFNKDKTILLLYPAGYGRFVYEVPETVTQIGYAAFAGNLYLANILMNDNVTDIDSYAFANSSGLYGIYLPANINHIGNNAFYHCTLLSVAYFMGNAPVDFGTDVFALCHGSFNIRYPDSATGWASPWFGYTAKPFTMLVAPVITANLTQPTNQDVTVTIVYPEGTSQQSYFTSDGMWSFYTGPCKITQNMSVYARSNDEAGNSSPLSVLRINNIDKQPPEGDIVYSTTAPTNGTVTVTLMPSENVTVTNNSGLFIYTFTGNGSFTFTFTDAAGNTGAATARVTNIDKNPPIVTGVVNNTYYKYNKTIFFNEGTAILNGAAFSSGSTVSAEKAYTLVVTDTAGNKTTIRFTIDKTAPKITLKNASNVAVTSGSTVYGDVTVSCYDTNYKSITAKKGTVSVSYPSGGKFTSDGIYTVYATDKAGNTATAYFAINKTRPVILAKTVSGSVKNNAYVNKNVTVTLYGYNLTKKVTKNGVTITYPSSGCFNTNGKYVITAKVGVNTATFTFTIDATKPSITAKGAANNGFTRSSVTITVKDTNLLTKTVTKNGSSISYPSKGLFSSDGKYVVTAKDRAGNVSTFTFTIDKTAPKITVKTLSGTTVSKYGSARGGAVMTVTDTNLRSKAITLNGRAITWPSSNKVTTKGTYVVTVKDKAGNTASFTFKVT